MPKAKPLPPLKFLNESFRIVEDSKLFWRDERPLEHFSSERTRRMWTSQFAGKEAGYLYKRQGYRDVRMAHNGFGRAFRAHRLIWAMAHQEQPCLTLDIDHIDGDRLNNHIDNLRLVTRSDNSRNAKRWSHNTSGVNGVGWDNSRRKWMAYIDIGGKFKYLGRFDDIEDAAAARKAANIDLGFTDRHGEKA